MREHAAYNRSGRNVDGITTNTRQRGVEATNGNSQRTDAH